MGYERNAKLVYGTPNSEPSFDDWADELKEWVIGQLNLDVTGLDEQEKECLVVTYLNDEGGLCELNQFSKTPFTKHPMTSIYCGLTGDEFGFGFEVDLVKLANDPNYVSHLRKEWFMLFKNVEPKFALGVHTS